MFEDIIKKYYYARDFYSFEQWEKMVVAMFKNSRLKVIPDGNYSYLIVDEREPQPKTVGTIEVLQAMPDAITVKLWAFHGLSAPAIAEFDSDGEVYFFSFKTIL